MSTLLIRLEEWGCDVKAALKRLLDDEEFLIDCIKQVAEDPAFGDLGDCLERGDVQGAFEAAHSLKGILANTGLTPLYDIAVQIVEPLRAGNIDGLVPLYRQLMEKQRELKKLLSD